MTADKMRKMVARAISIREGESETWVLEELRSADMFGNWTDEDFKFRPVNTDEIVEWLMYID